MAGLGKLIAEAAEAALPGLARKAVPKATTRALDPALASPLGKGADLTKWLSPADPGYALEKGWDGDVQALWDTNQITPPGPPPISTGPVFDPNQPGLPGLEDIINDPLPPGKNGELDLGSLIFNLVNRPDPAIEDITRLLDADQGRAVTPQMFATARRADPDGLRKALTDRIPVNLTSNQPPLGMSERVFHYSEAGGRQEPNFPGNPPFELFEPDRGGYNQTFDSLGPHVGTFDAADQRRSHKGVGATTYPDSTPPGYTPDFHGDAAPYPVVPERGAMLELAANLSRPFTPAEGEALAREYGFGGWPGSGDRWDEHDINMFLNNALAHMPNPQNITSRSGKMAVLRQDLANRGYTNVPYANMIEDRGSTSHVMLTDRGKADAVLRDRNAVFHPGLKHLPNLTAGVGAGGLSLGALLAGEDERAY